ncbi:MAG: alpha/beta fold hydrolase [Planctomycetaceae bacterium]
MSSHFIRTNGINLHYLDHPGRAPTIVLLPGLTASAPIFDGLIQAGLSPRFHVLAPDLRGRGRSDAPPTGADPAAPAANYTMADHAADVIGLLDALGIRRPVLTGHSFGGMLALYLAAHSPERFPRIVVLDSAMGLATPVTRELLRPIFDRLGLALPSWEAYLAVVKQLPFFQGAWDPSIESYFRADLRENPDGSVQPRARPDAIGAAVEGMLIEDWSAILAKVKQPVLLLNAQGPYGPPGAPPFLTRDLAMATVAALANARYLAVSGNHVTMIYGEGARQVVEAITAFLQEGHDAIAR